MTFIQRRPITDTFVHFLWQTKVILLVWAKFIAGVTAVSMLSNGHPLRSCRNS